MFHSFYFRLKFFFFSHWRFIMRCIFILLISLPFFKDFNPLLSTYKIFRLNIDLKKKKLFLKLMKLFFFPLWDFRFLFEQCWRYMSFMSGRVFSLFFFPCLFWFLSCWGKVLKCLFITALPLRSRRIVFRIIFVEKSDEIKSV